MRIPRLKRFSVNYLRFHKTGSQIRAVQIAFAMTSGGITAGRRVSSILINNIAVTFGAATGAGGFRDILCRSFTIVTSATFRAM
jgi:hypothetical protein